MKTINKLAVTFILASMLTLIPGGPVYGEQTGILPILEFDRNSYSPGDNVHMSLKLTGVKAGDRTNSVTFVIYYDGSAFEPSTGNPATDITDGYIKFTDKIFVNSSGHSSINVMYTNMGDNTPLKDGETVFSADLRVKSGAPSGSRTFTLQKVNIMDSEGKIYPINSNLPLSTSITINATPVQSPPADRQTAPSPTPSPAPTPTPASTSSAYAPHSDVALPEATPRDIDRYTDIERYAKALKSAEIDENGVRLVKMEVEKAPGSYGYMQQLPKEAVTAINGDKRIELVTGIATIVLPGNMINAADVSQEENVVMVVRSADSSALAPEVKSIVGNRPSIELSLLADGKPVSWNNPAAPVTVSIPYKPSPEELNNSEFITVRYIDGNGQAVPVPNGRYDAGTGMVIFTVTHFSKFAIAYVAVKFDDMDKYGWADKQVQVLAAKGIFTNIAKISFYPGKAISRADFLVYLINALGLTSEFNINFSDVKKSDYFYNAAGIAKKLGISQGTGNNKFEPDSPVSRQDLMVLAARALRAAGLTIKAPPAGIMDGFKDSASVAAYAAKDVAALIGEDLVKGSGNLLNPSGKMTRAEAAVLLYRIYYLNYVISPPPL
jgi:hypothetical protein